MTRPLPPDERRRRPPDRAYRSTGLVDRCDAKHPGLRALVEKLLRRRFTQQEISLKVEERFGVKISRAVISRFWMRAVRPAEEAEAAAYRQARAQARALLEEMKADPKLDAAQIAEIMLANQIVKDRMKLAEADILDLYREQRERKKLELQSKALRLREKRAVGVLAKVEKSEPPKQLGPETIRKIREIYGLSTPPESAAKSTSLIDLANERP